MTRRGLVMNGMHMHSLDHLLSRVVERKGFTVQGADQEGLLARKEGELLLMAWKTDGPVAASDLTVFNTALESVGATRGILVAPRGASPDVRDQVSAAKNLELWAESRLVVEVGEALVKDALSAPAPAPVTTGIPATTAASTQVPGSVSGASSQASRPPPTRFPSLIATAVSLSQGSNSGAAYYMPSKPRDVPPAPASNGGKSLNYAWGGNTGTTVDPGVAQIRNGRRPTIAAQNATPIPPMRDNMLLPSVARATNDAAPTAAPSTIIEAGDDVELISTPRRSRVAETIAAEPIAPAPVASAPAAMPAPMPAPRMHVETDEYEIITSKRAAPAPEPAPATALAMTTPTAAPATTGPADTLRIQVSPAEANIKAAHKVGNVTFSKLLLVPHAAFEYDARVDRPGLPAPMEGRGFVIANAITGELRALDRLERVPEPADARRESSQLQTVDLYGKVKSHITKQFSREVRVERDVGGTNVVENQRISPGIDELGLEHRGVVYVPQWELTGDAGTARVDGLTGNVL